MARTTSTAARARRTVAVLAGSLALFAAAGCGSDDGGSSSPPAMKRAAAPAGQAVTVKIASFKFKPETIRVKAGGTVTFANQDKAPHTAQTELNPETAEFDTARLAKGDRKTVKLSSPGRFEYFCAYHRFMEGTIEVVE